MDERSRANIAAARTLPGARQGEAPDTGGFASLLEVWRRRASESPQQPYLTFYDEGDAAERLSYGACWERIAKLATYLTGVLRLRPGDRLASLMVNHSDTVLLSFAAWCAGLTVVPINVEESIDRIRFTLENSEARALFVYGPLREKAEHLVLGLASLQHVVAIEEDGWEGDSDFRRRVAACPSAFVPEPAPELDTEAFIVYTSGTTGAPKGVILTQGNLLVDAAAIAAWHHIGAGARMMCVLPIHHVNGTVVTLLTPLVAGGSVVLNRRFRSAGFWRRVAEERVEIISVVPTLMQFLLEAKEPRDGLDLRALRHFICGAGPLTVDLALRFEERFGVPIMHGYGLSETTCYSCFLPLELTPEEHRHWLSHYGFPSIGVPLPCNAMAIFDKEGKGIEQPQGERGEIAIRGANVMGGYYQRPDANAETFLYQWFRSGDEGFMIRDARNRPFFFITGRIKELIIRGGVNLSPFEIDEVLQRCPGVKSAIAVGFEHDYMGEEVGAYVQCEPGASLTAQEIQEHCRKAGLSFAKLPKVVLFGEDIPVTSTGKYQRTRLQRLFEPYRRIQFRE